MLSPDRLERFARHIVLPEIGGTGQLRLAQAHVVVIGAGGVGSPALQYLAAAGVGRLTIVDTDSVDASNLQRQTIFAEDDIGAGKAERAAAWIARFDPAIAVEAQSLRINAANAGHAIAGANLVLDGCDNFATRLAVSDACVAAGVPITSVAVGRFQAQVANFAGHLPGEACYRCWVGDAFDADDCDTCAEQGVLGAFVGMAASLGVMQGLRVLLAGDAGRGNAALGDDGLSDPQWGQLHLIDGLKPSLRTIRVAKDPACRACG